MDKQLEFQVLGDITTKNLENENEPLVIEGIISTSSEDLYGDIVTPEALESLKKQAVGLNVFLDHKYDYDKVVGVVKSVELREKDLYATVEVVEEYAPDIRKKLKLGVNLGFSIGGVAERKKTNENIITDFNLIEVSLTALPANLDSYGTVTEKGVTVGTCLTGVCYKMLKQSETMEAQEEVKQEAITKEDVIGLINEAIAEKEEAMKQEITDGVKSEIDAIVEEKLGEGSEGETKAVELKEEPKEEPVKEPKEEPVEEPKEETSEEDDKKKETKSLDIDAIADAVFKKFSEKEAQAQEDKLQQFLETKKTEGKSTFLNSETRDQFGRNKKFLK